MRSTIKQLISSTSFSNARSSQRAIAPAALAAAMLSLAGAAGAAPGVQGNGRISFGTFYSETNGNSNNIIGMSDDGRYVTYLSSATNISSQDTNTRTDCYRYDRLFGTTLLMSVATNGQAGNGSVISHVSNSRMVTPDGRFALFPSTSSDLVGGDTNNHQDVFVRDTAMFGSTQRVSLASGGAQIMGESSPLGMSTDGRKILFMTHVSLQASDTNNFWDVYLYDRQLNTTLLVSGNAPAGSSGAAISENGQYVAFATTSSLVTADTNGALDIYWKDLANGQIRLASASAGGTVGNQESRVPTISGDGRRVGFITTASNLVAGDTNASYDVYVKDVFSNAVFRASTQSNGAQASAPWCNTVSLSSSGRYVAMSCIASDLTPGDTNGALDAYAKDLDTGTMTLVSRVPNGAVGNAGSGLAIISRDGAQVGFVSGASNLTSPDNNAAVDVFVGTRQ